MEELTAKLEEKYGFIMKRTEVMEAMKISLSSIKRMENAGKIVAIKGNDKIVKFHTKDVAIAMMGE